MKIICENGFYKFYPSSLADIRRFYDKYGVRLVQCEDYYTFEALSLLPKYSIAGQSYGGLIAIKTCSGNRESVMSKNLFTYNQATKSVAPIPSVIGKMDYSYSNYFIMSNLPQAYFYDNFGVITGFYGWVNMDYLKYNIDQFIYY
jgi:hypothetical protein